VSFAPFNGETFNQTYTVNAFNGASLVASQTLTNVAPNFNSGYGLIDLHNLGGITSVTITPTGAPKVWDYLIDAVAFNQSITSIVNPPPPPVVQPRPLQFRVIATAIIKAKLTWWKSTLAMTSTISGAPSSWSHPPSLNPPPGRSC
jgi:hypothetical protein